ncbi:MAG: sigma 54-interacting transcriptional regulator [Candidatus Aminicenantes bacterium]|nr:sigma 54-interacting transcriptional regulator [Candidatus Aminicenantes bacterium]
MAEMKIFESIPCGIFAVNKELVIIDFNPAAENITGYNKDQVLGRKCYEVFPNHYCHQDCRLELSLNTGEITQHWDTILPSSSGEKILICASTSPIIEGKSITGAVMSFRVISKLMDMHHQFEKEKHKLETILESLDEGVLTIDHNWQITSFNRRAEEITGFKKKEVLGKLCQIVFGLDDAGNKSFCIRDCPIKQMLVNKQLIPEQEREFINRWGKKLTLRVNFSLLKDKSGEVMGGIETFRDITTLKNLQEQLKGRPRFENIIGRSKKMQEIYDLIEDISENDVTVLIQGETGTGKELIASAIHQNSRRKNGPFIKINCSALPESLLESELFGHVKGAFTGAYRDKPGRFELADGGTLFLDEIGDISPLTQVKLLRVLEEQQFERVGGTKTIKVNIRLIAATNKDLKKSIKNGTFREDLYYRLNVLPIFIPPLRERREDIVLLAKHFLRKYCERKNVKFSKQALDLLLQYPWPGNIRELENAVEYAILHCKGNEILSNYLPPDILYYSPPIMNPPDQNPLEKSEKEAIRLTLKESDGQRLKAARRLGISRATLWRKIKKYNLA